MLYFIMNPKKLSDSLWNQTTLRFIQYSDLKEESIMQSISENMEFFTHLLDMMESELGQEYELVLHDLTKDYNHTIVDIRNGSITNRNIGDCGNIEILHDVYEE